MNDNEKRLNTITQEKRVSNWLTSNPISDQGFNLTIICDSFGIMDANLPAFHLQHFICACVSKIDIHHDTSQNEIYECCEIYEI